MLTIACRQALGVTTPENERAERYTGIANQKATAYHVHANLPLPFGIGLADKQYIVKGARPLELNCILMLPLWKQRFGPGLCWRRKILCSPSCRRRLLARPEIRAQQTLPLKRNRRIEHRRPSCLSHGPRAILPPPWRVTSVVNVSTTCVYSRDVHVCI